MKFRVSRLPDTGFQLAPMIDIVFLLLVFFIVSWSYARFETELDISVPAAAEGTEPQREVGEIILNVRPNGEIVLNGAVVEEETLLRKLQKIAEVYEDQAIILRGDENARHKHIVAVLDICQKAGIWNIAFATSSPDSSPNSLSK